MRTRGGGVGSSALAYSEAIKAVECAAHAVIQPNHPRATLGTMLGELKGSRHRFSTAIPAPAGDPIAPAEAMRRALWEGQTSRHGAQTATVPEALEAARAGVHLAAALVQWFVSRAVIRHGEFYSPALTDHGLRWFSTYGSRMSVHDSAPRTG